MYSPKIKEDYIPVLYKIARARRLPMTHIVREALDEYLNKPEIISIKTSKEDNNKRTTNISCTQCLKSLTEVIHE